VFLSCFVLQDQEPDLETCDVDYTNIKCVMVSVHNNAHNGDGRLRVDMQADVQCKQFPPALGAELGDQAMAAAAMQGQAVCWFKLGMLLSKQECSRLIEVLQAQVSGWITHRHTMLSLLHGWSTRSP
jgi:hypothetical protein